MAFTVEHVMPGDGEVDVERDVSVEVSFSSPVDEETVSSESFTVLGPAGPVAGEVSVDGNTITFVPSVPWSLLTDYAVELSTAVASLTGSHLEASYRFSFQVRDGRLRTPERLSSGYSSNLAVRGSNSGHVVVYWASPAVAPRKSAAVFFDPLTGGWGEPAPIEGSTEGDYTFNCIALNERGEAFGVAGGAVWNRAVGGVWESPKTSGVTQTRNCALADDGTAMTTWEANDGVWNVYAASLSSADVWSQTVTHQTDARRHLLTRYQSGFLAFHTREADSRLYSRVFEPAQGWLAAKPVTPPGLGFNYWSLSADGSTALLTWSDSNGRVEASLFDGNSWTTSELGPGLAGASARAGSAGHLAVWVHDYNAYAARHDASNGWRDPVKLGATSAVEVGLAVAIDASGNAFAAWPDDSRIAWRRSPGATAEWSAAEYIEDQDPDSVWSASAATGEVVLVWTNPLGVWATRFE